MTKIHIPEFRDLVSKYDLIFLSETRTDEYYTIDLPGFEFFLKHRSNQSAKKSRGLGLLARNDVIPFIEVIGNNSDFGQLFRIKKSLIAQEKNVLIASVYFPPDGSRFYDDHCYDYLVRSIHKHHDIENDLMLIVGDFNSRSGILNDIEKTDLSLLKHATTCPEIYEATDTRRLLEMNDVPLKQSSQDKGRPNALGYQLIDFCKNNDMIILNGRLGSDKGVGKVTSKEWSVLDYAIASPLMLPYIRKFEILDFDPIYSDVHCAVSLSIESIQHPDNSRADR